MLNSLEAGSTPNENTALTRPEPMVVELGKPFSITPNLDLDKVPLYASNHDSRDDATITDLIGFTVENSDIYGDVEVYSLGLLVEEHYPTITEIGGSVRPYAFAIEVAGEEEEGSVGVSLQYKDKTFEGEVNYDSLSSDDELIGYINDDDWVDPETDKDVYLAFPRSAVPEVEFTIYTASQPTDTEQTPGAN